MAKIRTEMRTEMASKIDLELAIEKVRSELLAKMEFYNEQTVKGIDALAKALTRVSERLDMVCNKLGIVSETM